MLSSGNTSKAPEFAVRKPSFDPIENNFARMAPAAYDLIKGNAKEIQMLQAGTEVNISEQHKTPKFINSVSPPYDCSSAFPAGLARQIATPTPKNQSLGSLPQSEKKPNSIPFLSQYGQVQNGIFGKEHDTIIRTSTLSN